MNSMQEVGDFDYGAFLREDAMDLALPSADRSPSTPLEGSPGESSSNAGSMELSKKSASKQRHERRGHTKSRRGCFNCKRRRIKVRGRDCSPLFVPFEHVLKRLRNAANMAAPRERKGALPSPFLRLFSLNKVSRDEASLRTLRQDGAQVRVSCSAANCAPTASPDSAV